MSDQTYSLQTRLGKFEHYISNLNLNANYQPIVIRYLINNSTANKTQLALTLANNNRNIKAGLNDQKRLAYFKTVPVYRVLINHDEKFIKQDKDNNYYLDLELSKKDLEYFEKLLTKIIHKVNEVYLH